MRITRFESNERVDLPDMTSVSFLPLGEFRRTVRGLIAGSADARIVNGFAVEASDPVDGVVTIVLDPGGGDWPSHAVLFEDTMFGQLAGGVDDQGNTEGNATFPLDFTGEPAGTYVVEMRFLYVPGDPQNRAFINQTTKVESTQQVDTRYLPTLEVRLMPAASGGEWVALAEVVWDGVSIAPGDITDLRVFALEGPAGEFRASAWGGPGGMPDPDRTASRENIVNAFWPAIRGIYRQLQDMKGFSDGGFLDHFSRTQQPMRAGSGGIHAEQTRSISSMDTEEYTVGDGAGTYGDFSGSGGLQACLNHIASQKAFLPKHVHVKVKTRSPNTAGERFVCDTPVDLSGVAVTIEFVNGNFTDGLMRVDFAHTSGTFFTTTTAGFPLTIMNLRMERPGVSKTVRPLINAGADNHVVLHNCDLSVSRSLGLSMITAGSAGTRITRTRLAGEVRLGNTGRPGGALIEDVWSAIGDVYAADGALRLFVVDGTSPAKNVTIRTSAFRQIIGHGASNVTIEDCDITHGHLDGIQLGASNFFPCTNWRIRNVNFAGAAQNTAGHAATNGAAGTGWGIHCFESVAPPPNTRSANIEISGMRITLPAGTDSGGIRLANVENVRISRAKVAAAHGSTALQFTGIELENARSVTIDECDWEGASGGDAANFLYRCVDVRNEGSSIHLRRCVFDGPDPISGSQNPLVIFQRTTGSPSLYDCSVEACRFLKLNTVVLSDAFTVSGLWNTVSGIRVENCTFDDALNEQNCINFRSGPSTLTGIIVRGNMKVGGVGHFMRVGIVPLRNSIIANNTFTPGTAVNRYFLNCLDGCLGVNISDNVLRCDNGSDGAIDIDGISDGITLVDNQFDSFSDAALANLGTVDNLTLIGNFCTSGTGEIIASGAPTNHIGWGDTDLNRAVFVP